ncbi:MAG: FAD:protein FMN transferase [Cognatishimia sp.]|uniref:FAD:protein FMN transferase n=1 Tax=Cognatishimia sp. TaxID=2211648 RepID=UPI003B8BC972
MPLALAACKKGWSILELTGFTMGTSYSVAAIDHSKSVNKTELQAAINASLAQVNTQMSNWDAGSEISRFNASTSTQPFAVSSELASVMQAAQDVHVASDGRFDVTLGGLIDLWGFGAGQTKTAAPTDAQIASVMGTTGHSNTLRVAGGSLQKLQPDTEVYLSAIGKGFGVDQVSRTIESFGIKDYMIEIGGDLYTAGLNPDGMPWQIGIETPVAHDRGVQQVVSVSNHGMATSGDYRNYFEQDGVRYSHILDGTTGRPVTHKTASVTVLTENAMLADAWATAMLVLGTERGLEIAYERDLAVLFIDRDADSAQNGFVTTPSAAFAALQA